MKQQVMTSPGKIEFRDVHVPKIASQQVLVRTMRIGVCGSDIHVYHGTHPYTTYPIVQGHEVSGQIEKVGSKVKGFKVGDRVTIQPQVVCGKCYSCTHGNYHICDNLKVLGFQTTGTASEYCAVDADKVFKLPEDMSFDYGAMVEPMAVAVHAVKRHAVRRASDIIGIKVLILGAGPIGNLVAQTVKALGAQEVMITDLSDFRLDVAKSCGIDYIVNPLHADLEGEVIRFFGRDKADLIFECVGANATIEQAIQIARKGTDIVVVGVFGEKVTVDLGLVQDRELRLIGTLMYKKEDFVEAIELLKIKKVNLQPLVSEHFSFFDYQRAYEYIDKNKEKIMKIMIDVHE